VDAPTLEVGEGAWDIQFSILGAAVPVSVAAFFQALDAESAEDSQPSGE